jgi:hypothetical protein
MLLASNKQHKEITKGRKIQRDRPNAQRTAGKKKDQEVLQETPHFQDSIRFYTEPFGKLQMLKFQK